MAEASTVVPDRRARDRLVAAILAFLAGGDLLPTEDVRALLEEEIDRAGHDALLHLKARLGEAETEWAYYPPDPLARRLHHVLADRLLHPGSTLLGTHHATAATGRPIVIFANHVSYADANLIEIVLHRAGATALAARLTAIAGPKVYVSRERRFSSLCYGTVRVPQNAGVSTGEAVMSVRDVARAARLSIDAAHERLAAGDALLVFGEGTRSRTAEMQPLLPGVTRYFERHDPWILPIGIVGTEALFPVGQTRLHPVPILVSAGAPFDCRALGAAAAGDKRLMVDAVGLAIADLLPAGYRGAYAATPRLADAARVLTIARAAS